MTFKQLLKTLGRVLRYLIPYWKLVLIAVLLTVIATSARLCQAKFVGYIMELMSNCNPAIAEVTQQVKAEPPAGAPDLHQVSAVSLATSSSQDRDLIFQQLFNYENGRDPFTILNIICVMFLSVMALMGVCTYFQKYTTDQCGQLAIRDFRSDVFRALQRLPVPFFDKMRSGEVLSRSTTDVITASGVFSLLSEFSKNSLIILGCFVWMFYRDWQMTLVVIVISPLVGMAISNFGKRMGQRTAKLQARLADLSALQYENVAAIKVVKANSQEDYETHRFVDRNEDNYAAQMKVVQTTAMQSPVVEFLGIIGIMCIVWVGATRIMQGQVSFSEMTEYWTLMVMTSHPLTVISTFYGSCQNSAAAAARAFEVIDTKAETTDCASAQDLPKLKGGIEYQDVCFAYEEGKPIIKHLSFSAKPGEIVAIVGTNGSGKSTMVNMLPRFYCPDSGCIKLDGHDIAAVTLDSLRRQVGIVFQESVLFRESIYDNIRYGKPDASEAEIYKAAELAGATEFIAALPDGYKTNVGERGSGLSGGQRQRIAIARALIHDPAVLILDEYTSGIDAESENVLTEVIERAMKGRTCIVIAHRLNTIKYADRILVMDKGQIVETGTHDELMAKAGIYSKIHNAQTNF